MTLPDPRALAIQTVKDPAGAARVLMDIGLPRSTLWTALVLMAVLQSVIFAVSDMMLAGPTPFPVLFGSPLRFFTMAVVALVLMVHAIHRAGRMLGGTGTLDDVLVIIVWLQALRVAVQVVGLILSVTIPVLAMLLLLVATVIGIYILLHFIDQAHRLGSIGQAVLVLFASVLVIVFGLSLILALIGLPLVGNAAYV